MTIKTLAAAVALTLTPVLAIAEGCSFGKKEEITMSCAAGTVYDAASGACIAGATS